MDFDLQWLLLGVPVVFALGWLASRLDRRQWKREQQDAPRAYYKGLNLLLNEQQDKAIDAFIEAVQADPDTTELHFALGNLFRRRGEYERAVRVHQHLLERADLPATDRDQAQYALAQDFLKAGLFDRAEAAYRALAGTAFATDAALALLTLHERSREWRAAIEDCQALEARAAGSFSQRIAHFQCELAAEALARGQQDEARAALDQAIAAAPQAPRPRVMQGQWLARSGRHEEALAAWRQLLALDPGSLAMMGADLIASARAAGGEAAAALQAQLAALHAHAPSADLLDALLQLDEDPARRLALLRDHLKRHPTLSAAQALLQGLGAGAVTLSDEEMALLRQAVGTAAKPLQRYRCAACGFEAQRYFWQCPGCQSWDSYPPRRVDEL